MASSSEQHQQQQTNNDDWLDWDNSNTPTYNPEEYCRNSPVLRCPPPGLTRSGRKKWREAERNRMRQFYAPVFTALNK